MAERKPKWNSRKAWGLVLGAMLLVGVANLWLAFRSMPEGFDKNWRYADAGVEDAAVPAVERAPQPSDAR